MSKLTLLCVLLALAFVAQAQGVSQERLEEPEHFPDALAESSDGSAAPSSGLTKTEESAPFDKKPSFALSSEDIMNMKSDPSTGTIVSGSSSSKSSSQKFENGVLVEDKKDEQTIQNDGEKVIVTKKSS